MESVIRLQDAGWIVLRGDTRYSLTMATKDDSRVRLARELPGILVTGVRMEW